MPDQIEIRQVVIWGYKLHSHTHSYIHNGFYKAFQYHGLSVLWLDESDDISNIDFSRSLFLTEHLVNKQIPCRLDCLYLTHYVDVGDFPGVPKEHVIVIKMSQRDFTEPDKDWGKGILYDDLHNRRGQAVDEGGYGEYWEYHAKVDGYNCWYTYWATDIFPKDIDENIRKLETGQMTAGRRFEVNFVGHMEEIWVYFQMLCMYRGIPFFHHGSSFSTNSSRNRTIEENMELIQRSFIAPAYQSQKQVLHRYIPCRIFKNISYGKMGLTNNPAVVELFRNYLDVGEEGVFFDRDDLKLMNKGIDFENALTDAVYGVGAMKRLKRLMGIVRDHHTFLNRLNTLKYFIAEFASEFRLVFPNT